MDDFEESHEQGQDVILAAVAGVVVFIVILVVLVAVYVSQSGI